MNYQAHELEAWKICAACNARLVQGVHRGIPGCRHQKASGQGSPVCKVLGSFPISSPAAALLDCL